MTSPGCWREAHLKQQIGRELDRLELLIDQIKSVGAERDAMLATERAISPVPAMLIALKGIEAEFATVLWSEGLSRHYDNRRQLAAYAGLAATPWKSGAIDHEQGCRSPAIRGCDRRSFNSLGYGCAIVATRHPKAL